MTSARTRGVHVMRKRTLRNTVAVMSSAAALTYPYGPSISFCVSRSSKKASKRGVIEFELVFDADGNLVSRGDVMPHIGL